MVAFFTNESSPQLLPLEYQRASGDFVFDRTVEGRAIKCLTIMDDATHEAVAIVPERAISGSQFMDETSQRSRDTADAETQVVAEPVRCRIANHGGGHTFGLGNLVLLASKGHRFRATSQPSIR